jgi:small-conductance mechanosensitive channel
MAVKLDAPLREFVHAIGGSTTSTQWLWQIGVAFVALGLAWGVARVLSTRVQPGKRWQFGEGDLARVVVPLLAWAFMGLGKVALAREHLPVALLQVLLGLTIAWLVIRAASYVLGHILPAGSFLRASVRTVGWIAWIGVALHLTGFLPEVLEVLDEIGISMGKGKQPITLLLVIEAIAALALTLTLAAWISRVTASRVLAADSMEMSTRVVIAKVVHVATLFLAVLIALPLVGIDVTTLSIFSGALGVGLGLGLQKIASNYVSGFIVLLDRSIRIGDLVTVGTRKGEVKAIETRFTVIKGGDGSESIIPNDMLITEAVTQHTYSDSRTAVVLPVTVSHESDVDRACAVLMEAARAQPRVIADPASAARIKGVRDLGIDLELTVWISDPLAGDSDLKSDLYKAILRGLREAAISLAYPRQEVRLLATAETIEKPLNSAG